MATLLCTDGVTVKGSPQMICMCKTPLSTQTPFPSAFILAVEETCSRAYDGDRFWNTQSGILAVLDKYGMTDKDALRVAHFLKFAALLQWANFHIALTLYIKVRYDHETNVAAHINDLPCNLLCGVLNASDPVLLVALLHERPDWGCHIAPVLERFTQDYTLKDAAGRGNVALCKWLTQRHSWTAEDARINDCAPFRIAAYNGYVDVCKWLVKHFQLTAADVCVRDHETFYFAVKYGHLEVCQWFADYFHVDATHVHARNCKVLKVAVPHWWMMEWMVDKFGVPQVQNDCCLESFHVADLLLKAVDSHCPLSMCIWVVERFHLTPEDVRRNHNVIFRYAVIGGDLNMCKWLANTFGLATADALDWDDRCIEKFNSFEHAAHCRHSHIQQWLKETFYK